MRPSKLDLWSPLLTNEHCRVLHLNPYTLQISFIFKVISNTLASVVSDIAHAIQAFSFILNNIILSNLLQSKPQTAINTVLTHTQKVYKYRNKNRSTHRTRGDGLTLS